LTRRASARVSWAALAERASTARAALDRIAGELAAIAFSDIGDYFDADDRPLPLADVCPAARRALAVHRVTQRTLPDGSVRESVCIRLHDKGRALRALAAYCRAIPPGI